jgi:cell division protein FtsL
MAGIPESAEVRSWRHRQEDDAFDRRDAMLSRLERVLLAAAVVAGLVLVLSLA